MSRANVTGIGSAATADPAIAAIVDKTTHTVRIAVRTGEA